MRILQARILASALFNNVMDVGLQEGHQDQFPEVCLKKEIIIKSGNGRTMRLSMSPVCEHTELLHLPLYTEQACHQLPIKPVLIMLWGHNSYASTQRKYSVLNNEVSNVRSTAFIIKCKKIKCFYGLSHTLCESKLTSALKHKCKSSI